MTRFSFSHCPKCGRLNIHGATCVCLAACTCPTDTDIDAEIAAANDRLTRKD